MKYLIITLLIFRFSSYEINAQSILKNKDSTLANYLEKNMRFITTTDTCFSGIYNITFKLSKENKLLEFDYSSSLPLGIAAKIKDLMLSLNSKWDTLFINKYRNKKIVQPIFLSIENNCTHRNIKEYSGSKTNTLPNLGESSFTDRDYMDMMISLANLFASAQNTFTKANNYKSDNKNVALCVLLVPALIVNEFYSKKPIKKA